MSTDRGKLGNFLKEVISYRWDEFCEAEQDPQYTGFQSTVLALVRTCSEGKLGAIKLAIDRIDGKIETPVKIEYPKIWFLFPDAKRLASPTGDEPSPVPALTTTEPIPEISPKAEEEKPKESAATLTLRETLIKLADSPRMLTHLILQRKKDVEQKKEGVDEKNVPLVKSVIAANLINLAEKNNFEAIMEVFDQIDGKLVETIRILGDDIFLTNYSLEAPAGAIKNKDGIYMIEAREVQKVWREKLKHKSS